MKPIYPMYYYTTLVPTQINQIPIIYNSPAIETKHSKRKFSQEEDEKLAFIVSRYGESNWKRIAEQMGTRNCRQCRERWKNYLCPNVCKEPWTQEEDELLQKKYKELGSQWSVIAKFFPSRTDVNIKNRWVALTNHTVQEKRVRRKGHSTTANISVSANPISSESPKTDEFSKKLENEKDFPTSKQIENYSILPSANKSPPELPMKDDQRNDIFHLTVSLFNENEEVSNLFDSYGDADLFSF